MTATTYPAIRRRLRLIRVRLAIRTLTRAARLGRTAGERRLAAFLAAAAAALVLLAVVAAFGVPPAVGVPVFLSAFFATFSAWLLLVDGPDDDELRAEQSELVAALPEAKRLWEEERERLRAEREAQAAAARETEQVRQAVLLVPAPVAGSAPPVVEHAVPFVSPPNDWLQGDGSFPLLIVGESYHQRALEEIVTALTGVGGDTVTPAVLRLEFRTHDPYAVSVLIAGQKVGTLSRADAKAFRLRVAGEGRVGPEFPCRAAIHGGGREPLTVRLDVRLYS